MMRSCGEGEERLPKTKNGSKGGFRSCSSSKLVGLSLLQRVISGEVETEVEEGQQGKGTTCRSSTCSSPASRPALLVASRCSGPKCAGTVMTADRTCDPVAASARRIRGRRTMAETWRGVGGYEMEQEQGRK